MNRYWNMAGARVTHMWTINGGRRLCYGLAIESLVWFTVLRVGYICEGGTSNGSGGADPRGSELCLWDLLVDGKL